jgi:hypothetical protein
LALDTLTTLQPSTELQTVTSTIGEFLDASVQADGSIQLFWLGDDLGDDRFSLYQWAPGQAQPRKLAPDLYEGHVYASLPQGSGSNLWFAASNDRYDPPRLIRLALDPTGAPLCLYDNED